jgi:flagellar hook protein FlgE
MSFNTALSGLRAANQDLSVTGNNIANASTSGFKKSRTEFGDVYSNSILGGGARTPGSGVLVSQIAQQFDQGNINITNNSLDMAINGNGFFILSDQGSPLYTRSGNFRLDNQGNVVSVSGANLQGFAADASGNIVSGRLTDLRIQTDSINPNATTEVNLGFNLDSAAAVPAVAIPAILPTALLPSQYNWSTAATVYDSLGNSHTLTSYYVKNTPTATGTDWDVYTSLDNTAINNLGSISFDTGGALTGATPAGGALTPTPVLPDSWPAPGGADPLAFNLDVTGSSQYGSDFTVNALDQDGYAPGRLTSVNIDDTGVVFARYTNGQASTLGQVALATFVNPQGLAPIGNTAWAESFDSGQPVRGAPQSGSRGSLQAGALEDSNVDISNELVNLILAQRNYQANAKTIETDSAVTQTIINLR